MNTWDDAKRQTNIAKHGVDFAVADDFEWDTALTMTDPRHDEARFVSIGFIGERLHMLVWTMRGDHRRIISLRKTNPRETRRYAES